MWRLTIIQKELKESSIDKGQMYESTNEIMLETSSQGDIFRIISAIGESTADNISYKIEKVVE